MNIGGRIRTARRAAGLSQEDVARSAGLSLKGMGEIERGDIEDPHISSLTRIARALGVSVGTLLKEEEPALAGKADAPREAGLPEEREEERRLSLSYLRSWRAFVYKLIVRWEKDPPKSSREIAVVLDAMRALLEEGAFERPPEQITTSDKREVSEWLDLRLLFQGIDRLNQIADAVEEMVDAAQADAEAERRRAAFREIEGTPAARATA